MNLFLRLIGGFAAALAGLLLVMMLAVWFISDRSLDQALRERLEPQGLTLQARNLRTTIPFALAADQLTIGDLNGAWLTVEQFRLRLQLLPLLTGRVRLSLSGQSGSGSLRGSFSVYPLKKRSGSIRIAGLELASIPLLTSKLGGQLRGTARLDLDFATQQNGLLAGTAKLQIAALGLKGASIAGMSLPDLTVQEARGLVTTSGPRITVDSLAMQGDGIYLRLTGSTSITPNAPLNLSLQLMPTAEFLERQKSIFLLMMLYQTAPGSYTLPISGTIASPQLAGR
ncbi:type II secretion system protein GspN [Trichlorobacter lovleyi]|uniref:type II secretion system protein GspN n=1 Tax=Trichlorobacter lovleyi TaxID=313985 RepID=UPI0022406582|nr:type II secretion system protein GspN [Trichlorobacter lovleyi]QOX78396.1 type II secretion system protein GspN [Trichlorobacter lovleyi]